MNSLKIKFHKFHLRNISFKQRILATNLLMVVIPVCLLAVIGLTVFGVFKILGPARQMEIARLWPEKGPAVLQQYALNDLKHEADEEDKLKSKDVMKASQVLESQGLRVCVFSKRQLVYSTPGTNLQNIRAQVSGQSLDKASAPAQNSSQNGSQNSSQNGSQNSPQNSPQNSSNILKWEGNNLSFQYISPRGNVVWAAGTVPFLANGVGDHDRHEIMEAVFYVILVLAILVIILLGRYFARMLSRQLLVPLAELSTAATRIGGGNLDEPVKIDAQGELGDTCATFEQMRVQLKEAKNVQEKYEQNRKELLAGISHDLSTPLTAIKGYASGIAEGVADTPEKQRRYVERITQAANTMEKLVSSLFLFSKLDLGRVEFRTEPIKIGDYFRQYVEENVQPLAEQGLYLTMEDCTDNAVLGVDIVQWQRVVNNLLGNSLKYKNGDTVDVQILLTKEDNGHTTAGTRPDTGVKISFIDNGQGVETEDLTKIFDSFYRTDKARTNVQKGSGLGLAIVKKIVTNLNGSIWAEHSPSGGLTVCVLLPQTKK